MLELIKDCQKNNHRKGFTLVELLAVVVILAIISLITVPIINKVIEDNKKGSVQTSAYNLISSAEKGYHSVALKEGKNEETYFTYNNGKETRERGNIVLKYSGNTPESGSMLINRNGDIEIAVYLKGFCAVKKLTEDKVKVTKMTKENCEVDHNF